MPSKSVKPNDPFEKGFFILSSIVQKLRGIVILAFKGSILDAYTELWPAFQMPMDKRLRKRPDSKRVC